MANSSLSAAYGRCFVIFIACVILLEGCIYFGFALWGFTQRVCSEQTMNFSANPFQFATDLIYFISQDCSQNLIVTVNDGALTFPMNWADSYAITNRMYIFLITYGVISILWIVLSVMVLFAVCGAITKMAMALCFWPWFGSIIAGSILDVVAMGFFIDDITHTTTAASTFEYVGADISSIPEGTYSSYNSYFVTPAVTMTCISSRLILIWLLNVFGASFCISLVQAMVRSQGAKASAQAAVATAAHDQRPVSPQPVAMPTVLLLSQEQQPAEYPVQIRPKPLPIQTPPQTPTQAYQPYQPDRRSYQQQPPQSPTPLAAYAVPAAAQAIQTAERQSMAAPPPAVLEDTTYRNTETHPDRLNYPPSRTPIDDPSHVATPSSLSTESILNTRYSQDPLQQQAQNLQHQQRVSDELRSQMPWSYTSMLVKPPPPAPPRKPQVQIYPEIPEPDYVEQNNRSSKTPEGYSRW